MPKAYSNRGNLENFKNTGEINALLYKGALELQIYRRVYHIRGKIQWELVTTRVHVLAN